MAMTGTMARAFYHMPAGPLIFKLHNDIVDAIPQLYRQDWIYLPV